VNRRARVDIANGERMLILGDFLNGDLPAGHSAEKTVLLHANSVDCLSLCVDSPSRRPRRSYRRFTVER
jgi:hypothetical protein